MNQEDLVVLGVANPRSEENPYNQDVSEEEVEAFLTERGYTYPVVMDTTGEVFQGYGVTSFPTTFMIDRDGNVFGYITGMLTRSMMDSIIEQTMSGERTPVQELSLIHISVCFRDCFTVGIAAKSCITA